MRAFLLHPLGMSGRALLQLRLAVGRIDAIIVVTPRALPTQTRVAAYPAYGATATATVIGTCVAVSRLNFTALLLLFL